MLLFLDRVIKKCSSIYNKKVFLKKINSKENTLKIYGEIYLINPNIELGKNVVLYPNIMFFGDGKIIIEDNVSIGMGTIIYSSKKGGVHIGKNTQIAAQCYIIDMDHGIRKNSIIRTQENTVGKIEIGDDVWIAANSVVLKGSNIKDGAIIGANSLVKGIIPPYAIAVGSPAKVIKYRE